VPWKIAGWDLGAWSALFGRNTVYSTIQAVETFVDQHYQQQIDQLQSHPEHETIVGVLTSCQTDEVHHKDDAVSRVGCTNLALKLWSNIIGIGSCGAVAICRRV
jgi:ubiquinone biosynthesis monooxygenase Coq7